MPHVILIAPLSLLRQRPQKMYMQNSPDAHYIRNSETIVQYVTIFAVGWVAMAYVLDAPRLMIAALIATFGFIAGSIMHRVMWHGLARVTWLTSANVAVLIASFVTPREGSMSYIFVAIAAVPFVIFSLKSHRDVCIGFSGLPVILWMIHNLTPDNLIGPYDVEGEAAVAAISTASGVTVFGVVLFIVIYFVIRSNSQMTELEASRYMLEKESTSKTRLLNSLSHELRNPLQAISGHSNFLKDDIQSQDNFDRERGLSHVKRILKSCIDMQRIVDNIYDFLRPIDASSDHAPSKSNLRSIIQRVISSYEFELEENDLSITCDVSPSLHAAGSPSRLEAAFKHLFDNAVKYTDAGGSITVTARSVLNKEIVITISDTGAGFSKGTARKALVPFERLDHETGTTSGVGLGLALASRDIEAIGGKLIIAESPTRGAVVRIVLPVADEPNSNKNEKPVSLSKSA